MIDISKNLTLRACRTIAGVKASEIADAVGVKVDTVYKWERGESFPNGPQLVEILNCFAKNGYIVNVNDINFFG